MIRLHPTSLAVRFYKTFRNPPGFVIAPGTTLVVMVNPEGRGMLEKLVGA